MNLNEVSEIVIGSAIEVHRELGPGLLESTYEACLAHELEQRGVHFERQKKLPVEYKQLKLEVGYRVDFLVEARVLVEVKSVAELTPVHEAQIITYLKLSRCKLGLLMNFNTKRIKDGLRRFII